MSERVSCDDCRFWEPTRLEDSGLLLADRSGPWYYQMGRCVQPKPALGTPSHPVPGVSETASFSSCYMGKRARAKRMSGARNPNVRAHKGIARIISDIEGGGNEEGCHVAADGLKTPATDLLREICEDSARYADGTGHKARVNAALMGFGFALALAEQDGQIMHRLAEHLGITPHHHLTDPERLVARFAEALDESAALAPPPDAEREP